MRSKEVSEAIDNLKEDEEIIVYGNTIFEDRTTCKKDDLKTVLSYIEQLEKMIPTPSNEVPVEYQTDIWVNKKDAVMISQISAQNRRKMLLRLATNKYSLNSDNHDYDMEYIRKLDLGTFSKKVYDEIRYYLFIKKGIINPKHKENLEKLLQGELVERSSSVSSYLDALQSQIDDSSSQIIESTPVISSKPKSRILRLFRRKSK